MEALETGLESSQETEIRQSLKNECCEYIKINDLMSKSLSLNANVVFDVMEFDVSLGKHGKPANFMRDRHHSAVTCETLLHFQFEKGLIIFVEGPQGSGKSIFMKNISCKYLENRLVPKYDVVLSIDCNVNQYRSYKEMIEGSFKKTVALFGVDKAIQEIRSMKSLLIFERYDLKENSKTLVHDIFENFKNNLKSKIIITSETDCNSMLKNKLDEMKTDYQVCTFKTLSRKKQQMFLENCLENYPFTTRENIQLEFYNLQSHFESLFGYPEYIILFCNTYEEISRETEGFTSLPYLVNFLLNLNDLPTESLVQSIGRAALFCLHNDSRIVDQSVISVLRDELSQGQGNSIFLDDALKCLLNELPATASSKVTYTFFNDCQLNYLASRSLLQQIVVSPKTTLEGILAELIGQPVHPRHLKKYVTVSLSFKFVFSLMKMDNII